MLNYYQERSYLEITDMGRRCRSCGRADDFVKRTPLKDMRKGTNKSVKTTSDLLGNRPTLSDKRKAYARDLNVKNPLRNG